MKSDDISNIVMLTIQKKGSIPHLLGMIATLMRRHQTFKFICFAASGRILNSLLIDNIWLFGHSIKSK